MSNMVFSNYAKSLKEKNKKKGKKKRDQDPSAVTGHHTWTPDSSKADKLESY